MLGIIGGSGLYEFPELVDMRRIEAETPFGVPSEAVVTGRLGGTEVAFLARHGRGHRLSPSELPYRANIYALKELGVTHLISVSAVGSLREELPPRSVVVPDQIIDRTVGRARTFFEDGIVAHVGLADPFCGPLRQAVLAAMPSFDGEVQNHGTYVCIEGPQFSTRAESRLFRSWQATVVGMTVMPEARLAREAELCYATVAMVTDYDVWHETEADVSVAIVLATLQANIDVARQIIGGVAETGLPTERCPCQDALAAAIVTAPDQIPAEAKARLRAIIARHVS